MAGRNYLATTIDPMKTYTIERRSRRDDLMKAVEECTRRKGFPEEEARRIFSACFSAPSWAGVEKVFASYFGDIARLEYDF